MIDGFMNQVRRAASDEADSRATTRTGIVTSYDPANYAIKVMIQPEGVVTGWLPLKAICAGNGWGIFCPPAVGTAISLDFQEADGGAGSAGLSFFNDEDRPLPVPSGEIWLVHASGASVKLTNDGKLTLDDGAGAMIALGGGQITSTGPWTHTGAFEANGIGLTTHHHTGVQTGSGMSGAPAA